MIKYFTQAELKKLFRVIDRRKDYPYNLRDLAMFHIGYLCGLRSSEIGLLRKETFNERTGELFCSRKKNSYSNTIRLDETRIKVLKKHLRNVGIIESQAPIFSSKQGNPISPRMLDVLMKHYCETAKLPRDKAHWHTLKHSIAVHLAESGADVKELQNYLGHKKIENTMIYFQFTTRQEDIFYQKIRKESLVVG